MLTLFKLPHNTIYLQLSSASLSVINVGMVWGGTVGGGICKIPIIGWDSGTTKSYAQTQKELIEAQLAQNKAEEEARILRKK